jgi:hypothetical protein
MNKVKGFVPNVTPELLAQVREVLDMAAKSRYSVSKVYGVWNAVMGKTETPQTCPTCLRNRVKGLREWYEGQALHVQTDDPTSHDSNSGGIDYTDNSQSEGGESVDPIGTPDDDTAPPQDEERPDGVELGADNETRTALMNGAPIDVIRLHVPSLEWPVYFEPGDKDLNKGTARYEGGGSIKPGKYETSDGRELAVQPGGRATLKENLL